MKKILFVIIGVLIALGLILVLWWTSTHNTLIRENEDVNAKWAQVETQYQRRMDLIPNLIATVQGAKDFEQETLTEIARLRSAWQDNTGQNSRIQTANQMESALARLLVIVENYPDLKSNANFIALQDELANTENKISVERGRYNEAVRLFNAHIQTIPTSIVANSMKLAARAYFDSDSGAETPPVVSFT